VLREHLQFVRQNLTRSGRSAGELVSST
jgi:hypothetical protein